MTTEETKKASEITLKDGRRVFVFVCVVMCSMLFLHMSALILVAASTVPRISKRSLNAYKLCVTTAKDAKIQAKCVYPTAASSKSISAKILDAGAYPWIAVIVVWLGGLIFYLMQSREDWSRTREVLQIGATAYSKNAKMPDWLSPDMINKIGEQVKAAAASQMGGDGDTKEPDKTQEPDKSKDADQPPKNGDR